jgi:hypothetical protein
MHYVKLPLTLRVLPQRVLQKYKNRRAKSVVAIHMLTGRQSVLQAQYISHCLLTIKQETKPQVEMRNIQR